MGLVKCNVSHCSPHANPKDFIFYAYSYFNSPVFALCYIKKLLLGFDSINARDKNRCSNHHGIPIYDNLYPVWREIINPQWLLIHR